MIFLVCWKSDVWKTEKKNMENWRENENNEKIEKQSEDKEDEEVIETYWNNCLFYPSNEKQEKEEEEREEKEDLVFPWSLQSNSKKGYYAISNRNYQQGEIILKEKYLIDYKGWFPFTNQQIEEIKKDIKERLTENEKIAFYKMSNVFDEYEREAGIYMTNSFDMLGAEQLSCGMYLVSSFNT